MTLPARFPGMHAAYVLFEILLSFTTVAALGARDGLVIAMTQKMPLQRAPMRETRPTHPANVGVRSMLLLHVEPVSACLVEFGPARFACNCFRGRVDGTVSL